MKRHGWLLWAILPLLLFAGIWWLTSGPQIDHTVPGVNFVGNERAASVPTRAEAAALQSTADAACRCSRTGIHDRCWAGYRRDIARFQHFETEAMCMEESPTFDCFPDAISSDGPSPPCITTQRPYNTCSDAELRIAEARRQNNSGCGG